MKTVRVVLIVIGAAVVLLIATALVALNSGFQTWAVRKAMADRPGLAISVGKVDAGLKVTEVTDVRVRTAGAQVTLPRVQVQTSLVDAARKQVNVRELVARGWTVDLTQNGGGATAAGAPVQAASAQAAAVFRGVLSELRLPVDLTVGAVDLEGDVVLPAADGRPPLHVHVKLTGGQLGVSQPGTFTFDAATTLEGDSPVQSLRAHSVISAAMDTPRTFSRLAVDTALDASGPQLARPAHLVINTAAERQTGAEQYVTSLASDGRTLLSIHADFPANAAHLTGTWEIAMSDADVTPYTLGLPLPQFHAEGRGQFQADASFSTVATSGKLDMTADNLERLQADLGGLGALKLSADFDVMHEGGATVRVNRLVASVTGAKPVLQVEALQPFAFNPQTAELKIADPTKELLQLNIDGVPLAWVQPFLKGLNATGSALQGQLFLTPRNGGLSLRSRSPLTVTGVTVAREGQPLMRDVDVSLAPSFDFTAQGWQAESGDLSVRSNGVVLVEFKGRAGRLAGGHDPLKVTGQWSANLPALLAQPVLAGKLVLTGGEARGDFAATIDGREEIQANIALTNLAVDPQLEANPLPSMTLDLRADIETDGRVTFTLPLAVERQGRKSDLNIAGTLANIAQAPVIDARVTGDYVWLDDLKLLAAPLAQSDGATAGAPEGRNTTPVWAGVTGKISLALKKVVYGADYELSNIAGTLTIARDAVKFEQGQAQLGAGSDLQASGAVAFDARAAQPYTLQADVKVQNFDPGPLFKAVKPSQPPTVEGIFNASTTLTGSGENVGNLFERTHGDVNLTSKGGKFRMLSADLSDKIQKSSSTVAAIGGIIGAVTGKSQPAEYANKTQVAADIAKALSAIAYDQVNIALTRDENLNFNLKDFSLIAPEVRLSGTGEIRHADNVPLLKSVLALSFQLGARGKLADKMKRISLLEAKPDALGYTTCNIPLKIGGTLENPDAGEWQRALLNAALEKSGLFNELLGK